MKTLSDIMALSDAEVNKEIRNLVGDVCWFNRLESEFIWRPSGEQWALGQGYVLVVSEPDENEGRDSLVYTSSLDACQTVKEKLTPNQLTQFVLHLGRICLNDGPFAEIIAPASKQSRALLAALTEK